MDTALDSKQTDSRQVLAARADKELAQAYEQITRADEQIAHAEQQLSKLEREADPGNRSLFDRPAVRGLTGLLLAACIGVAAFAWQSSYRDVIARWAPQRVVGSSPPLENPALPAQPSPPGVQAAAAETAPPQPEFLAQTAPEDVAPTAATLSPELTQLIHSMARDLATLGQGMEQLKASQEQMARDNANAAAQLKANQEQMARVLAKVSEQSLRPRVPTPPTLPPPRPLAPPPRTPVPTR
jgi:septal ring factor EnvC (AmiA/AmiB activator)